MTVPAKYGERDPDRWARVHIEGDRRPAIHMADRRRGVNRKNTGPLRIWTRGSNGEEAFVDG